MVRAMQGSEGQNKALLAKIARLEQENKLLRQRVDLLMQKIFGRSSEKTDPNQLTFDLDANGVRPETPEAALEAEEAAPVRSRRTRGKRMELPADLPVVEERIIPDEVRAEPEAYRQIGEEVTEMLDIIPARCFKRRIIRLKFVRKDDRSLPPVIAPAPRRVIDNSIASPGFLCEIACAKYIEHQPLYRQEQYLKRRFNLLISRKLMSGWMFQLAQMLAMIHEELRGTIRASDYIQIDETPVRYLNPGSGKCGKGYLWTYLVPGQGVFFEWHTSRSGECLKKTLSGMKGFIQSDGYGGYPAFLAKHDKKRHIRLACCMAHARRKFHEAREESDTAREVLALIASLYRVEDELRGNTALDRVHVRQQKSIPLLTSLHEILLGQKGRHLPQSATGKAIDYTLSRWEQLTLYTRHAQIEIDNNLVENAIRPTAVGKKNWLFFGSAQAGQTSAIFYSLIGTCRMLGIVPEEYMLDVISALPTMTNQTVTEWTPAAWKARKEKSTA